MKRFLSVLFILLALAAPALAENRVHDNAGLFTAEQISAWESWIEQIMAQENFDVVLVTENSIGSYSPQDYAADFYDYGGYGYGENHDGILLLLVVGGGVGNRDFYVLGTGRGEVVFSQYVMYDMEDDILPALKRSDFVSALDTFLGDVQSHLVQAHPKSPAQRAGEKLPLLLAVGLGVGLITSLVMKAQMRTVRRKQDAMSYVRQNSFQLTRSQDIYLYTTTTRHRIVESSPRGSGGGGFSGGFTGSSGTHHSGHGGKF